MLVWREEMSRDISYSMWSLCRCLSEKLKKNVFRDGSTFFGEEGRERQL